MKQIRFLSKCAIGVALCAALAAVAADSIQFESRPGSKVKLDGTSTVHDWTVESQIIKGTMEVPADFAKDPAAAAKNTKVEVTIPVRSLKSGKSAMNTIMWEAMKMKEHPNIEYKLLELTPKSGGAQGASAQFDAKGALKVAAGDGGVRFVQEIQAGALVETPPPESAFYDYGERSNEAEKDGPHDGAALEEKIEDNIAKNGCHSCFI